MKNCSRKAFTLVELVMVIVIIGLLAAVVIPKFTDIRTAAQNSAETGTVSGIQAGVNMVHMANLANGADTYPSTLDSASNAAASSTNPLFTTVLDGGITDGNWTKTGTRTYTYTPTAHTYTYNQTTGTFTRP